MNATEKIEVANLVRGIVKQRDTLRHLERKYAHLSHQQMTANNKLEMEETQTAKRKAQEDLESLESKAKKLGVKV